MNKEELFEIFYREIEKSAAIAERKAARPAPRDFLIELHGVGIAGDILTPEKALDRIYISQQVFWPLIDISLKAVTDSKSIVFVRVSDFPAGPWSSTFDPISSGPFKQIESMRIDER